MTHPSSAPHLTDTTPVPPTTVHISGRTLVVRTISDAGIIQVYCEDTAGELYADVTTTITDNTLVDSVWVKVGGIQESIADSISFLSKTKVSIVYNYNTYMMYNFVKA